MVKKKGPARISDVARLANVSPGTVSRALAGSSQVQPATARRVIDAAEALHYRPNLSARRLSTGRTLAIAVIVPFFTRPAVSERLSGAVGALADTPYDLAIHNVATSRQRAWAFERFPNRHQVDGVLVISLSPSDEDATRIVRADVPVVFIDADCPDLAEVPRVVSDDVAGGRCATEHLIGLGHRRIGFVGDLEDDPFHFTSGRDRARGFLEALAAEGLGLAAGHRAEGDHDRFEARRLAAAMLSAPTPPTAVFASSDTQAFGVLEAARDLGLRVPDDLSVVGYDDIEMADVVGLTTVRQSLYESGRRGMELLLELLRTGHTPHRRCLLPTELVVRRTTAAPRR